MYGDFSYILSGLKIINKQISNVVGFRCNMLSLSVFTFNASFTAGFHIQGPVAQSIVCLTSLLRVISSTILVDSIYNILIFFAEKNVFALQKLLTFFQQKISAYLRIT